MTSTARSFKGRTPLRVLVTGGAGFIGSHTVELLLEAGHHVVVFDNFSSGKMENLPVRNPNLVVVRGDVSDLEALSAAAEGRNACLHLAAQVSVQQSWSQPDLSCRTNILGFINLLQVLQRHAIGRCVFASSAAVYGTPVHTPIDERDPLLPLSPYGLEKLTTEKYAELAGPWSSTRFLGLRYFNVFGPRQDPKSHYAGVISKFQERMIAGQPLTIFGDGGQTRDFIFVKDVATANVAAIESAVCGNINVCTGKRVSLLALISALSAVHNRVPEQEFLGPSPGDIRESCGNPIRLQHKLGVEARWSLIDGLRELDNTIQKAA